jgi:hypothetical protein
MSTAAAKLSSGRARVIDGGAARTARLARLEASDRSRLPPAADRAEWKPEGKVDEAEERRPAVRTWNRVGARVEHALFALMLGAIVGVWLAKALVP